MQKRYEILIRFDEAGNLKGGHTQYREDTTGEILPPAPLGTDPSFNWPDIVAEVNQASLSTVATKDKKLEELNKHITANDLAKDALETGDVDKITSALAAIADAKVPVKDAKIAELEKQKASIQAEIDKLQAQADAIAIASLSDAKKG